MQTFPPSATAFPQGFCNKSEHTTLSIDVLLAKDPGENGRAESWVPWTTQLSPAQLVSPAYSDSLSQQGLSSLESWESWAWAQLCPAFPLCWSVISPYSAL